MEFDNNSPIYLQIAQSMCERILSGEWDGADGRIPSVRELSVQLQVNPNTTMRSYDYLQQREIIYNKRGIGFFVSPQGKEKIAAEQKNKFLEDELPRFLAKVRLLGLGKEETLKLISEHF